MEVSTTCTNRETDFFKFDSFVWIASTCTGFWWAVASTVVNLTLTPLSIYFAAQRYRYERHIQFLYHPKFDKEKYDNSLMNYLFFLSLHQLIRVCNFLFLVYTNGLQILLSAIINTIFNYYMYKNKWIDNDYDRVNIRNRKEAMEKKGKIESVDNITEVKWRRQPQIHL